MYEYIEGLLVSIHPTYLVLTLGGLAYRLHVANPYAYEELLQQNVKIYIEMVVREDSMTLYGFKNEEERTLFLQLNTVKNIGPKSAMSILAAGDYKGLVAAIDQADIAYLTKFPGIGKKTAQQIILDLQGKLALEASDGNLSQTQGLRSPLFAEVKEALLGLGYSQREIDKLKKNFEKESFASVQEALSYAFSKLIR